MPFVFLEWVGVLVSCCKVDFLLGTALKQFEYNAKRWPASPHVWKAGIAILWMRWSSDLRREGTWRSHGLRPARWSQLRPLASASCPVSPHHRTHTALFFRLQQLLPLLGQAEIYRLRQTWEQRRRSGQKTRNIFTHTRSRDLWRASHTLPAPCTFLLCKGVTKSVSDLRGVTSMKENITGEKIAMLHLLQDKYRRQQIFLKFDLARSSLNWYKEKHLFCLPKCMLNKMKQLPQ